MRDHFTGPGSIRNLLGDALGAVFCFAIPFAVAFIAYALT